MSSFGVMCKAIGHSIWNRLLYLPVKYQGPKQELLVTFNDYSKYKTAFLYSLFVTFLVGGANI